MSSLTIEINAKCPAPARVRKILKFHRADFKGLDHQLDTYFRVPSGRPQYQSIEAKLRLGLPKLPLSNRKIKFGRLKLREGNIENALIYYKRVNRKSSKRCDSTLYPCSKTAGLKKVLAEALSVLVTVDKKREIYFIDNVKFHIDKVKSLGDFVEIEVFGKKSLAGMKKLMAQSAFYQKLLGIQKKDLVADSYSDQLIRLETIDRRLKTKSKK